MNSNYTILVIDDSESYCKVTARWLHRACGCNVTYACEPTTAKNILYSNLIKVIIFDWRMPIMLGTELNNELRKIDKKYKSILLTAQAPSDVVSEPSKIFNASIIKNKDDYCLPSIILELISEYDSDDFKILQNPFHIEKIGGFFSKNKISYRISSIQVLDSEYIDPNSWTVKNEDRDIICAGESKTIKLKKSNSQILSIAETLKESKSHGLSAKLGLSGNSAIDFDTSFSKEIEQSIQSSGVFNQGQTEEKTWTRTLPSDSEIQYERFETADVYIKIRVFISISFSWSKQIYSDWYDLTLLTKSVAGRFYQCMKNRDTHYIKAGVYTLL